MATGFSGVDLAVSLLHSFSATVMSSVAVSGCASSIQTLGEVANPPPSDAGGLTAIFTAARSAPV